MAIKFEDAPAPKSKPPAKLVDKSGRPGGDEHKLPSETAPEEVATPHTKEGAKAKRAKTARKSS